MTIYEKVRTAIGNKLKENKNPRFLMVNQKEYQEIWDSIFANPNSTTFPDEFGRIFGLYIIRKDRDEIIELEK